MDTGTHVLDLETIDKIILSSVQERNLSSN